MGIKLPMAVLLAFSLTGCQQAYYNTMEKFGVHKREILVDRVEEARDSQIETQEQFKSALERFSEVVNFDGGDLEKQYEALNDEYEKSEKKAAVVHDHIEAVDDVANALFEEWEAELEEYSSDKYKGMKQRELAEAKKRYAGLIKAMRKAESKIAPVLAAFKDQVLFLKHSLNAKAVASLKSELVSVRADVSRLVREMQKSIDASNAYIESLSN
ncbi:MAG: DUF2959 domain-containing protein [Pseudomonadales bacterium]|nr:DUF2959 domain-containing protein [Pseudomonadales bacterium]